MRESLCWDEYVDCQAAYPPHVGCQPIYLSGVHTTPLARLAARGARVGLVLNPAASLHRRVACYRWWAADNGCYSRGDRFDGRRWLAWLDRLPRTGCLFVVAPDAFNATTGRGDCEATWARSQRYLERVRALGFPVALALQDGADAHLPSWDEAERWDAAFVAGSTAWKLSQGAADCCREAALLGKWVHVGRVNTWRRLHWVSYWPVDSVDGTRLRHTGPADPHLPAWIEALASRREMFPAYVPLAGPADPTRL